MKELKPPSSSKIPTSSHDLERALVRADDARDIAKDLLKRLPGFEGIEDEPTARHEIPHMHVHVHQHSEPDLSESETTVEIGPVHVKGLPKWLAVGIAVLVAAVTALLASRLAK